MTLQLIKSPLYAIASAKKFRQFIVVNYIRAMFTMSSDIHNAGTRNAKHNLILPKVRTSMAKNAFRFSAARGWNELPKDIKEAQRSVHFR